MSKKILVLIIILNIYTITKVWAEEVDPTYLSETVECEFTDELKELTKQLEYNPVKIYNWVHENIQYEGETSYNPIAYTGSRKGAHCTYLTKGGNAWDISSLLIALLRISGIPARYACHTPEGQLPSVNDYVYVEGWISTTNYRGNQEKSGDISEKIWLPMAPWNDAWDRVEGGINLFGGGIISDELQIDFDAYLSKISSKGALELFEEKLQKYLTTNFSGKTLKDIPLKIFRRQSISILPFDSFSPNPQTYAAVPASVKVTTIISFKKSDDLLVLEKEISLAEIASKRFCLDFIPASEQDRQITATYGGMCKTPAYMAQLKPVLRLEGEIIQEGLPLYTGETFRPVFTFRPGFYGPATTEYEERPLQPAGTFIQIGFDALSSSEETIQKTKDELKNIPIDTVLNDTTREEYLGRLGQILMTSFLLREREAIKRANDLTHIKSIYTGDRSIFHTFIYTFPAQYKIDSEAKFLVHPVWNIDARCGSEVAFNNIYEGNKREILITSNIPLPPPDSLNGLAWNDPLNLLRRKLYMFEASYNESRIFEDWQDTPGASTVKGIMAANIQGIPVLTLTKDNLINGQIPELEKETTDRLSNDVIQLIKNELGQGQTVTVPARNISYQDINFWTYMTFGPKYLGMMFNYNYGGQSSPNSQDDPFVSTAVVNTSGAAASKYTGVDNQQNSTDPQIAQPESKKDKGVHSDGDPVDMVTGEFYHEEKPDFEIKSRGVKLEVIRKYKSRLIYNGPFGYGWTWNHGETLVFVDTGDLVFYNADAAPYYLTSNGDGSYQYPSGTTFIMEKQGEQYVLTQKDKSKIYFNDQGLLIKKEDVYGNALIFEYDRQNNLTCIRDPLNRTLSFSCNSEGKINRITDFLGRSCCYEYKGDDLVRFTDLEANTCQFQYLTNEENSLNDHNMSKYILPNGDYLEIGYYKNDTVAFHKNKKGEIFSFQYSRLNHYAETWNEEGYYRKILYNENQDVIRQTTREKTVEIMEYDNQHNLIFRTDANGYTTAFTYDERRNLTSQTNALGEKRQYEYHPVFNKPAKIIDPMGNITHLEYDSYGNLIKTTNALGCTTIFSYDVYGNLIKTTDSLGFTQKQIYDSDGLNIIEAYDKNNNRTVYYYDSIGNVLGETDPLGSATNYQYNHYNQKTKVTDSMGNVTYYEYDTNGNLIRQIEPNGAITQNIYDTSRDLVAGAKISQIIDPLGFEETFNYDKLGNLITKTDKRGNTTKFVYDELNRLVETIVDLQMGFNYTQWEGAKLYDIFEPYKNVLRYKYDGEGNLVSITDRRANTTTFTYDKANRKTSIVDCLGNTTTYEYDTNGNQTGEVDPRGTKTKYEYDPLNRVTKKIAGEGLTTARIYEYEYDSLCRLVKTMDPLGNYVVFGYDSNGNKIKETFYNTENLELKTQNYTYDSRNLLSSLTDPNGNKYQYEYDALRRKTAEIDPSGSRVEYTYDKAGNLIEVKNQLGNTTKFSYNGRREKISVIDALATITYFGYDGNGNLTSITDAQGNVTEYHYDGLNRKIGQIDPQGNSLTFDYDENSNLVNESDALGNTTKYTYDKLNRIIAKTDALGNCINYEYDSSGNLISIRDANSNFTRYEYDNLNHKVKTIYPDNTYEENTFDLNSNLIAQKTRKGDIINYTFDGLNRLVSKSYPDNSMVSYTYDKGSRLIQANTGGSFFITTNYQYDNLNRMIQVRESRGGLEKTINYEYDKVGNRIKIVYPDSYFVTYNYDFINRLTTIKGVGNETIAAYKYDTLNRRTALTFANNTQITYEYDNLHRLLSLVNKTTIGSNISRFTYSYDKAGNRISKVGTSGVYPLPITENYAYDKVYQLTAIDRVTQAGSGMGNHSMTYYPYDRLGNRTEGYNVNNLNQYTAVNGNVLSYDTNGSLTNYDGWAYTYDYENRLTGATNGTITANYQYDAFGRRIFKEVLDSNRSTLSAERYLYDGDQIICEYDSNDTLLRRYIYGIGIDEPVLMEKANGDRFYYGRDVLGSISELTDSSGRVVEYYEYDAFGKTKILDTNRTALSASRFNNRYGFTGREYDVETGLYHYRKRAYSPELGRFLQTDPVGYDDDINLYRYVRNNPLRYLDPMGLKARTVWGNWYDFVNSDPILSDIGEWGVGFGESIVGLKDLPRSIGTFVMHPVATVKAIPGAVQQTIENLSDSDTAPRTIGRITGDVVIAVTTAAAVKVIKQANLADDVTNIVDKAEDAGKTVGPDGILKGFHGSKGSNPFHALDRVIERGVSPEAILNTLKNPTVVLEQSGGRILYVSSEAAIVMDSSGQAVTVIGATQYDATILKLLENAGGGL